MLHEEASQMSLIPTPAILFFLSLPALMTTRGILYDQLAEEEKTRTWFIDFA